MTVNQQNSYSSFEGQDLHNSLSINDIKRLKMQQNKQLIKQMQTNKSKDSKGSLNQHQSFDQEGQILIPRSKDSSSQHLHQF